MITSISNSIGSNILVTGGAGFIGSHVIDELVKKDVNIFTAVDNLYLGNKHNLVDALATNKLTFEVCDITKHKELENIILKHKIDTIFHLAVVPLPVSITRPVWCLEQNVKMIENLCELARKGMFNLLVNFSSSEVYGNSNGKYLIEGSEKLGLTPYAASKIATDAIVWSYVKTFNIKALTVRPFNNYGPRQNYKKYAGVIPTTIMNVLRGIKPIISGDGLQTRDFVFVKDTAQIAVKMAEELDFNGETYNISTGKGTTIKEIVERICEIMNWTKGIEYCDPRPGDVKDMYGSQDKLNQHFVHKHTDLDEGLRKTVAWYKEQFLSS